MENMKKYKMLDDIRGAVSNYFEFRTDNLSKSESKLKKTYIKSLETLENDTESFFDTIHELTSILCEVCLDFEPKNKDDIYNLLPYQKRIVLVTGALVQASFHLDKGIKSSCKSSRKNKRK